MAKGSYEQRESGRWSVRYPVPDGGSKRKSGFHSKSEAQAWLRQRQGEQLAGVRHNDRIAFREMVAQYLDQYSGAAATVKNLRYRLGLATDAFGDTRLMSLTPQQIGRWRNTLPEGTRHDALRAVKQVLSAAVKWRIIPSSPADGVENPAPKRKEFTPFESWDEVRAIESCMDPIYRGLPAIVVATGLRPQEWVKLRWEHVDLDRARLDLPLQVVKSGTPARTIPLRQLAIEALAIRQRDRGFVFPNGVGQQTTGNTFTQKYWKAAQVAAGVEVRRPYDMRHTFATWYLRGGGNTFALARRMGTSLEMIEKTYGHLASDSEAHERELMDAFDRAGSPRHKLRAV